MKKVFVAGYFNILHPGHLRLLRFAKELGDHLTVMVIGDEKNNPRTLLSQEVRLESIKSIGCVDHAFISKLPVSDEIEKFSPDFVVKGKEYEKLFNPEKNIVEKYPNAKLIDYDEVDTIHFGSTNKHVILSHGSFSAIIGYFAFFSDVYYPEYIHTIWFGDMFSIELWNKILLWNIDKNI